MPDSGPRGFLSQRGHPHVLNLLPPLNLNPEWFAPHNVLRSQGMKNFDQYSVSLGKPLMKDLFLD